MKKLYLFTILIPTFGLSTSLSAASTADFRAAASGASCSDALEAVSGSNAVKSARGTTWFSFTTEEECLTQIAANSAEVNPETAMYDIYPACGGNPLAPVAAGYNFSSFRLEGKRTYYLRWENINNFSGSTLTFTLSHKGVEQGDFCDIAVPVSVGAPFSVSKSGDNWFSFTAAESGWVEMDCAGNEADTPYFKADCGEFETDPFELKGEKYRYMLEAGREYRFCIPSAAEQEYTVYWQMGEKTQGDNCGDPIELAVDEQVQLEAGSILWHKVAVPHDGKYMVMANVGFDGALNVKRGGCDAEAIEAPMDYNFEARVCELSLVKGEELLLRSKNGDQESQLIVYAYKQGDSRENPLPISHEGEIAFEATPLAYRWYAVTPQQDSLFVSSAVSGMGTKVRFELYRGDEETFLYPMSKLIKDENNKYLGYENRWKSDQISAGEVYTLKVRGSADAFTFLYASPTATSIGEVRASADGIAYDAASGNYIVSPLHPESPTSLTLYSMTGVRAAQVQGAGERVVLGTAHLTPGSYVLRIANGDSVRFSTLVIR